MQSFVLMKNSVVRLMDNSLNSAVPQRRNVHEENIGPSVLDDIQFITYRLASVFDNCLQRSPSCNFDFWQCTGASAVGMTRRRWEGDVNQVTRDLHERRRL